MITLLALVLRLALLAVFTFLFVALYEHGPADYFSSVKTEWSALRAFAKQEQTPPPALAEGAPALPTPVEATPNPTAPPLPAPPEIPPPPAAPTPKPVEAWEALQKQPIGDSMNLPIPAGVVDPTPPAGSNP